MLASLQIHIQILGGRALSVRPQGFASVLVGVLLTASVVGCGQKGPLFLPSQPLPLIKTTTAPTGTSPAASAQTIPDLSNRLSSAPK